MNNTVTFWQDKPLQEYTKEELINIVIELGQLNEQNSLEHMRQLDYLKVKN